MLGLNRGVSAVGPVTRRRFLKRTGSATAGVFVTGALAWDAKALVTFGYSGIEPPPPLIWIVDPPELSGGLSGLSGNVSTAPPDSEKYKIQLNQASERKRDQSSSSGSPTGDGAFIAVCCCSKAPADTFVPSLSSNELVFPPDLAEEGKVYDELFVVFMSFIRRIHASNSELSPRKIHVYKLKVDKDSGKLNLANHAGGGANAYAVQAINHPAGADKGAGLGEIVMEDWVKNLSAPPPEASKFNILRMHFWNDGAYCDTWLAQPASISWSAIPADCKYYCEMPFLSGRPGTAADGLGNYSLSGPGRFVYAQDEAGVPPAGITDAEKIMARDTRFPELAWVNPAGVIPTQNSSVTDIYRNPSGNKQDCIMNHLEFKFAATKHWELKDDENVPTKDFKKVWDENGGNASTH